MPKPSVDRPPVGGAGGAPALPPSFGVSEDDLRRTMHARTALREAADNARALTPQTLPASSSVELVRSLRDG